ncbi:nuclear pore complex-interacting protein family member B4-like [Nomascus leucogenys]|uniref:nuclear pore complex-interacting protein family member B4-like n=1 Tax=Nomascus leucogenys TaxID=61853 RepID=UPI00122D8F10|nr:nuclear pore complex-interacting protein family member B4-like [Nomascus leucogenys]
MAAVEHHHSSGLPYWPYLTAETFRKRKGRQAPPPTQCHLGGQPPPSAKDRLRPLNLSRLQCRQGPQPHSTTDEFLRRDKLQVECPLAPVPFPPAEDFVSLKTPPECLLVPLPPSPVDDFLTPENPPIKCCRGPVPSPRADNKLPAECRQGPLSFHGADDFRRFHDSLSLKTPPECLLVPLPPSAVDDFVTPETPPIECRQGPLPSSRVDDFSRQKTPPNSFFVPLPPSPVHDFLTPETPPVECRRRPYHFFELMILGDARHHPTLSSNLFHLLQFMIL